MRDSHVVGATAADRDPASALRPLMSAARPPVSGARRAAAGGRHRLLGAFTAWIAVATLVLSALPAGGAAQEVAPPPPVTPTQAVSRSGGPSPGGAFLRAVLVPGWGHAAIGSYTRAGFYFAAETATAYALIRTIGRLSEAREHAAFRERLVRSRLTAEGVPAEELELRLEEDPALADIRRLVAAREEQREDWIALGVFVVLLSGVDAYVSTHLADFPAPISMDVEPGARGGVEAALRLSIGP